jgi:hypothetical protein
MSAVVAVIALCLSAAPAAMASPLAASALSPSGSLLIYLPGRAITATLKNGVYTQRSSFVTRGWTAAAASRDSLAFYNRITGKLWIGTFRGGIFHAVETRNVAKGFTRVVASCDTILLYKGSTGLAVTATLTGGHLGARRSTIVSAALTQLVASCDSTHGERGDPVIVERTLVGGRTEEGRTYFGGPLAAVVVATSDSFLTLDTTAGNAHGIWARLIHGTKAAPIGEADGFGAWDMMGGSADSILFYHRADGVTAISTLVGGAYSYVGLGPNLGDKVKFITAGR